MKAREKEKERQEDDPPSSLSCSSARGSKRGGQRACAVQYTSSVRSMLMFQRTQVFSFLSPYPPFFLLSVSADWKLGCGEKAKRMGSQGEGEKEKSRRTRTKRGLLGRSRKCWFNTTTIAHCAGDYCAKNGKGTSLSQIQICEPGK